MPYMNSTTFIIEEMLQPDKGDALISVGIGTVYDKILKIRILYETVARDMLKKNKILHKIEIG